MKNTPESELRSELAKYPRDPWLGALALAGLFAPLVVGLALAGGIAWVVLHFLP